ncbi:MAG: topoisomerase DNA-binding C4 zinc finger domain-containing protein [Rhizobium sp.]|nr:topoisomerase DNA-binding C4 zinc finger domain-containing protein [Rhizobium sp.]
MQFGIHGQRRGQDGSTFLGCNRFPSCRETTSSRALAQS